MTNTTKNKSRAAPNDQYLLITLLIESMTLLVSKKSKEIVEKCQQLKLMLAAVQNSKIFCLLTNNTKIPNPNKWEASSSSKLRYYHYYQCHVWMAPPSPASLKAKTVILEWGKTPNITQLPSVHHFNFKLSLMPTAYNMNIQQRSLHTAHKPLRNVTTEPLISFTL